MVSGTHPQSTGTRAHSRSACRFYLFVKSIQKGGDSLGACTRMMGLEMYGRSCWNEIIIKRSI